MQSLRSLILSDAGHKFFRTDLERNRVPWGPKLAVYKPIELST